MTIKMVKIGQERICAFLQVLHRYARRYTGEIYSYLIRIFFFFLHLRICNGRRIINEGYEISKRKFTTGTNSNSSSLILKALKIGLQCFQKMIYSNPKHMFHTGGIVESLKSANSGFSPRKFLRMYSQLSGEKTIKTPVEGTDRPVNSKVGKYL